MICLQCSFQLTLSSESKEKNMRGNELEHNWTWSSAGNAGIKKNVLINRQESNLQIFSQ